MTHPPLDRKGLAITVGTFLIWGVVPLYWHLLKAVPSFHIIAHRIVWSAVLVLGWLLLKNGLGWWRQIRAQPRAVPLLGVSNGQPASLLGNTDALSMASPNEFALNAGPWQWRESGGGRVAGAVGVNDLLAQFMSGRTAIERQVKVGGFMVPAFAARVTPGNVEDDLDVVRRAGGDGGAAREAVAQRDAARRVGEEDVALIHQMPEGTTGKDLEKVATQIVDALRVDGENRVFVGIGTLALHLRSLAKSYKEAQIAIEVGKVFDTERYIINYENLVCAVGCCGHNFPQSNL